MLVNNAGRVSPGNGTEGDVDDWDKMIYLNLRLGKIWCFSMNGGFRAQGPQYTPPQKTQS